MIRYDYKAKNIHGKVYRGQVEAGSDNEFYKYLESKELFCISKKAVNLDESGTKKIRRKLKLQELSVFCREFSVLLESGINIMTALQLLYERESKKELKDCIMRMIERIKKGDTLYEAMKKQGDVFPVLLTSMVLAGESSGSIDRVIAKMAIYYEKEASLKAKLQNAMIYPSILITVTFAVIIVLFTFVLPQFFQLFENQELPWITSVFMKISQVLTNNWYNLLLGFLFVILLIKVISIQEKVAYKLDTYKMKIPVFGRLFYTVIMAHFANAMSILYVSGITITKCLEISSRTVTNHYISEKLVHVRERVEKGETLSTALQGENLFDHMFWSMIHIGEESGNLEAMFDKLSEYLEQESETAVQKMMAILEPTVLIVIALIIGSVIASVLLPIYSMYQVS